LAKSPNYQGGGSLAALHAAADPAVKAALETARGLREFLATVTALSNEERASIVEQALILLEGFYVHLPLKRAMHAIDPLQRLRLLRHRLGQLDSEVAFHHEMTDIFTSLRDLHTNYLLPAHFAEMVAFLPFRVESCVSKGKRIFVVSSVGKGFDHATFKPGVEVTYWNAMPIERAVEIAASYHAGSNPAARRARGIQGLTVRPMRIAPPPDEEWVSVGYRGADGKELEFWADWAVSRVPEDAVAAAEESLAEAAVGLDLEGDAFRRVNKMLFAQHVFETRRKTEAARAAAIRGISRRRRRKPRPAPKAAGTDSLMPDVFTARPVEVDGRRYSYVRIYTFNVDDDRLFIDEFLRLVELPEMPKDGLIIDVRSNGGGLIWAGERLLQLLTPRTIEPCRAQFINSTFNLMLCRHEPSLRAWLPSLSRALESGSSFSAAFPITPPERCNDLGQRYYGPVVLVTDARCYSTTDIFAAGFQDHGIGPILGTDETTGAGGANVWTLDLINRFFAGAGLPEPLKALPKGAGMRVAIRRTLRVGPEAGTELEDFGVICSAKHGMTRNDVLNGNVDLIAKAAALLKKGTPREFAVTAARNGDDVGISVKTKNVEAIDVFVDGRPRTSKNVGAGATKFNISAKANAAIELRGYSGDDLVCRRLLAL
jgi:C-terminal processing protease CtpA/Prc